MNKLSWIHLSDLHFGSRSNTFYESLLDDISKTTIEENRTCDFIVLTGDVAWSGQSKEYELAKRFIEKLMIITKLTRERLLIVPGNHDLDLSKASEDLIPSTTGLTVKYLKELINKQKSINNLNARFNNFKKFYEEIYHLQIEYSPLESFLLSFMEKLDRKIAVICFNTAIFSGLNPYKSIAHIGTDQVTRAIQQAKNADILIGIMHHPPDLIWAPRAKPATSKLLTEFNFLLHGTLHRPAIKSMVSPETKATIIGAGATTSASENAFIYNLTSLDLEEGQGEVIFRRFSQEFGKFWGPDNMTYKNVHNGTFVFTLSKRITGSIIEKIDDSQESGGDIEQVSPANACILHLSDLHFGRHHTRDLNRQPLYADESSYEDEIAKLKADITRVNNAYRISPDYIVVTGDIAEFSKEKEYQFAKIYLDEIRSACGLSSGKVLMVPGNHDINWNICQSERLKMEALDRPFDYPYFVKFQLYQEFFNNFYRRGRDSDEEYPVFDERLFVNYPFLDQGIFFIGFNSCVRESELTDDHYGWISVDQVNRAINECNRVDPDKRLLRIALMHHNYCRDSAYDNENLSDADDIEIALANAGIKLILHGHQHVPKATITGIPNGEMHVLATGSAGLDAETLPENARRYQYIVIQDSGVNVYRRRFEPKSRDHTGFGAWVSDPVPEDSPLYGRGPGNINFTLS